MARSLDELHEQTRKLNIRDTADSSGAKDPPSQDSTQECKCQQSSSKGRCAQCPRHPAAQCGASSDNKKNDAPLNNTNDKDDIAEDSNADPLPRCFECKTDGDKSELEQSPGTGSAPQDEGGAAKDKGPETGEQNDEGQEDEEERTLTLEELMEYREKKGLKDGEYLLEFGFGFPEEREVNLNVQIEGDFSVTVLM